MNTGEQHDAGLYEVRTERLLMRRWRDSDLGAFAQMNADPAVMEFMPGPLAADESHDLARFANALFDSHGFGLWAVEVPGVADFVGFVGLNPVGSEVPFAPSVEIGWRLALPYWGLGYATEAARAALGFAFSRVGLDEVVSYTARINHRSAAVMRRIGMRRDASGDFDHPKLSPGHPLRSHVLYRITQGEFRKSRAAPSEHGSV